MTKLKTRNPRRRSSGRRSMEGSAGALGTIALALAVPVVLATVLIVAAKRRKSVTA